MGYGLGGVGGVGGVGCGPVGGVGIGPGFFCTSVGVILVLYILLVIILRAGCF
ncbi:hypothetical protein Back11_09320 [Paenibacillus baekrokdamisoli]|uniref:Uncharacterized protein n=1 Tax=Paenibacillus baekrokdamisoli TaxID=1712516 RepID=A0A3G9IKY5_9BACL|nr:hypothetical protein [Paenibacillus baekrokdamisoli]MBB3067221.1 hypothetical protein [Paenibacillus baekrokdamisoli]BBH19587.1 hypothetical protein Back11_09320 [Paenibacillus baekrokdamisoli]